ncbi:hypothetical protein EDD27_9382 [Nonomuraea polychroma]|uniref:Uncharacterized protein n=1 Tax=Nonomuraea polychroma TaxID=46176 RepID=A0A438ML65_9ACTN|nr:hypothetical protein EDD27_9382 [Nonomuraea polychroma]
MEPGDIDPPSGVSGGFDCPMTTSRHLIRHGSMASALSTGKGR